MPAQILLTGATGFIGGSILAHLLASPSPALKEATITCLMRGSERAATLESKYGSRVRAVLYKDIDDLEATTAIASQHDIVIGTTLGFHPESALALMKGLAQRKAATGHDVWMIHTSGTSNLGDRWVSGTYVETPRGRVFDDASDDIYGYEKKREAIEAYPQRTTELAVVDAGLELGVRTVIMMAPLIYGQGTGLFNQVSIQVPTYVRAALANGRAVVLADGSAVMDHVHVADLADLYELAMLEILERGGEGLPAGKQSIIFSANGHHTWHEIAQQVATACVAEGKIESSEVQSVTLEEGVGAFMPHMSVDGDGKKMVELALSTNARTAATVARRLGWKPTRGEDAWKQGIKDYVKAVIENSQ